MKGEKRLKEIQRRLSEVLKDVSPESVGRYEIQYRPIERYHHEVIGAEVSVDARDSPAYELYLVSKDDPTKSYKIMHVFWPDIREKTPPHMAKYYGGSSFAEGVKKGIEELQKDMPRTRGKPSKLETLEIISILSILISIFFMQSNFTGFAITNLTPKTSNTIGITLFAVGLIGAFYYFRKKGDKRIK